MDRPLYEHPYPSEQLARRHPFRVLEHHRRGELEMRAIGRSFLAEMDGRRSVRMFAPDPVPLDMIERAVGAASTAPSGAHRQPWRFVVTGDPTIKSQLREAAEAEERKNYEAGRMNQHWRDALEELGTDWHKEYIEVAPWIVVLFEQRYLDGGDGSRRPNYYVKESVGIAAGIFITALHRVGLVTLTHTPSPMAFVSSVLGRPASERPFALFPVGYPLPGAVVPDLRRKALDEVMVVVGEVPDALRGPER